MSIICFFSLTELYHHSRITPNWLKSQASSHKLDRRISWRGNSCHSAFVLEDTIKSSFLTCTTLSPSRSHSIELDIDVAQYAISTARTTRRGPGDRIHRLDLLLLGSVPHTFSHCSVHSGFSYRSVLTYVMSICTGRSKQDPKPAILPIHPRGDARKGVWKTRKLGRKDARRDSKTRLSECCGWTCR